MQQDFGTIIYLAVPSTRLRAASGVFASKFTSVFRRYRQFRLLHRSASSLGFSEPPDVKFPSKQLLHSLKTEVVNYRRERLEQWLRAVAGTLHCHMIVYEFLGIAGSQPLEACLQNFGELCVTSAIHRLVSEPHMKLGTLEFFDQKFFPKAVSLRQDYVFVFFNFLFPIVSDDHAGSRALRVLRSLISRKQFKGANEVLSVMPLLSRDVVKKARLDTHIIERWFRGTREDACEVFKTFYEECASQGPEVVLDLSHEALALFHSWYTSRDLEKTVEPVVEETPWCEKTSSCGKITVKYRAVGHIVESETQLIVNASIPRVIETILQPDLRRLWDLRITKCTFTPTEQQGCYDAVFELESGGKVHSFPGTLRIAREGDTKVVITYAAKNGLLQTSYEITALHQVTSMAALSTDFLPKLEDLESADWSTPRFQFPDCENPDSDQCLLLIRCSGGEAVARLFVPDLLGEGNMFMTTWVKFTMVAEGGDTEPPSPDEERDGSLNEALSRKSLRSMNASKRRGEETVEGTQLLTRKLERRMFIP